MEAIDNITEPIKAFAKDSIRLVTRCTKPDSQGLHVLAVTEYLSALCGRRLLRILLPACPAATCSCKGVNADS
eukprot:scaffold1594_cov401-Prasinococcus_capsulatus_cf.AAC.28